MFTVNINDTIACGPTERFAEASTIRLPPGQWPEKIELVNDDGRRCVYHRDGVMRDREGELHQVHYRNIHGTRLSVAND